MLPLHLGDFSLLFFQINVQRLEFDIKIFSSMSCAPSFFRLERRLRLTSKKASRICLSCFTSTDYTCILPPPTFTGVPRLKIYVCLESGSQAFDNTLITDSSFQPPKTGYCFHCKWTYLPTQTYPNSTHVHGH